MKPPKLKLFVHFWIGFLYANFLVLFYAFITAYSSVDKSVVIYINKYGEANWELAYLLAIFFITPLAIRELCKLL